MRKVSITFTESAVDDLEQIQTWYREQGVPEVGERFARQIFERVGQLQAHPDMGRIVPEFGQTTIRELIHSPFRIVYRREAKAVRVVRVWRSERLLNLPDGTDAGD